MKRDTQNVKNNCQELKPNRCLPKSTFIITICFNTFQYAPANAPADPVRYWKSVKQMGTLVQNGLTKRYLQSSVRP